MNREGGNPRGVWDTYALDLQGLQLLWFLKKFDKKLELSQTQLTNLSNMSIRIITSYEHDTGDIPKAQTETLY